MPQYKVKHQGQIKVVDYDGSSPTKEELRAALEMRPTLDYNLPKPGEIPNPTRYEPKDWIDKIDPSARRPERADRNMFTVDLSRVTNRAVDRAALSGDDAAENKWKAQKLGFASGAAESALNMLGQPESVLTAAPRLFRQRYVDYPGHSINPKMNAELVPVGEEQAYNSSFPKAGVSEPAPINYMERYERARSRMSPMEHLAYDETGAIGPNIRKGHISGRFIKKGEPYEADSFDVESSKSYVPPEPIDYVKQMLDSLKLADEQKKLAGLSPKKRR